MEPDILSSAGEATVGRPDWPASVEHPARDTSVDATTQPGSVSPPRSPKGSAVPWPRPANGLQHAHGYANGHARPRNGAHGPFASPRVTITGGIAPVLPFETPAAEGVYLRFGKRVLDVLSAVLALAITSPVLLALAILIKLESRGPVIYRSTRIGRGGRPFHFYKLRSMVKDADRQRHQIAHMNEADGPVFKIARDPRITRIGRFLRSTSLDEIPQFYNVLIGDMSFVGPRPERPEFVAELEEQLSYYAERHMVKPGITGWAQINYPYGASIEDSRHKLEYDLYYAKNYTPFLDMLIILQTLRVVLWNEGAR